MLFKPPPSSKNSSKQRESKVINGNRTLRNALTPVDLRAHRSSQAPPHPSLRMRYDILSIFSICNDRWKQMIYRALNVIQFEKSTFKDLLNTLAFDWLVFNALLILPLFYYQGLPRNKTHYFTFMSNISSQQLHIFFYCFLLLLYSWPSLRGSTTMLFLSLAEFPEG